MTFTYQDALNKLRNKEPFAFSRWGDGEWSTVLGHSGMNCDRHEYFTSLGAALREVLDRRGNYIKAMQPKAMGLIGGEIADYCREHSLPDPEDWPNADIFHDANKETWLKELFEVLDGKFTLVCGPHLIPVLMKYIHADNVMIPPRNAWLSHGHVLSLLMNRRTDYAEKPFLFCAGMMSNVLIDELWWMYPQGTYIDLGSALDPHAGIASRRYHKEMIEKGRPECA